MSAIVFPVKGGSPESIKKSKTPKDHMSDFYENLNFPFKHSGG